MSIYTINGIVLEEAKMELNHCETSPLGSVVGVFGGSVALAEVVVLFSQI